MPQLNPSPWFMVLMFSWMVLLLFMPMKLPNYTYPNDPALILYKDLNQSWSWPWF